MHQNQRRNTLLDMLDERSLTVLKNFGHIYTDPKTGKRRMRPFSHPKILQNQNGQPNRDNRSVSG